MQPPQDPEDPRVAQIGMDLVLHGVKDERRVAAVVAGHAHDFFFEVAFGERGGFAAVAGRIHGTGWRLGIEGIFIAQGGLAASRFHIAKKTHAVLGVQDFGLADITMELEGVEAEGLGRPDFAFGQFGRRPKAVETPEAPGDGRGQPNAPAVQPQDCVGPDAIGLKPAEAEGRLLAVHPGRRSGRPGRGHGAREFRPEPVEPGTVRAPQLGLEGVQSFRNGDRPSGGNAQRPALDGQDGVMVRRVDRFERHFASNRPIGGILDRGIGPDPPGLGRVQDPGVLDEDGCMGAQINAPV